MLEYARWKYILVAVVLLLALLFALPNVFGEDPALQVERKDHSPVTQDAARAVESFLRGAPRPLRAQLHRRRAAHGALRRGGRSARGPRCRQRAVRRHLPHRAVLCAAHPGAAARRGTAAHAARARPARRAVPALSG